MICPNKNSAEWRALVEKHGEVGALIHFNSPGKITASVEGSDLRAELYNKIIGNESYYLTKYKTFLSPLIGDRTDTDAITTAFYARLKDIDGKLVDDVIETSTGNYLLFPETEIEYKEVVNIPSKMDNLLTLLQRKHNIPFKVIHEPSEKWGGRYVNQGDKKVVIINTAYATPDTPLHEYYHPFVRKVKLSNSILFNRLYSEAAKEGDSRADQEEVVTDYLTKHAKSNRVTQALRQFWQFISNVLGLKGRITVSNATTLSDVLVLVNVAPGSSNENTLTSAYKKEEDILKDVRAKITDRKSEKIIDYIEELKKIATKYSTSDSSNFYQDETGKDVAKRLTAFIGDRELGEFSVKFKKYKDTYAVWGAKQVFKSNNVNVDDKASDAITETIELNGKTVTFEEVLAIVEKEVGKQRVYGKMVHSFMQYLLESNKEMRQQAKEAALGYAKEYGEDFYNLETHPRLKRIYNSFSEILDLVDLHVDPDGTKGIPKNRQDKIIPEVTLLSDLLVDHDGNNIATTADGIIQHYNGELSMLDWKTGNITKDMNTAYLMKYGDKFDVKDSRLSRGYLEMAFRAMIMKEKFPDVAFRNIQIVKLNEDGTARLMNFDLQAYLYTIGEYYKVNHPKVYAQLKERGLLDANNYQGTTLDTVKVYSQIKDLTLEDQITYLKGKLSSLHHRKTKGEIERDPEIVKASAVYARVLLEIEKLPSTDLGVPTRDLSSLGALKGLSDIKNAKVQTLNKVLLEAKQRISDTIFFREKVHDKLLKDVLIQSDKTGTYKKILNFAGSAGVIGSVISLNFPGFVISLVAHRILSRNLTKTKDLFDFMWKESNDMSKADYLNTDNFYTDRKGNFHQMTSAQIAYRDFIKNSMKEEYDKFANVIVGYTPGNHPITRWESLKLPRELPENFMPRIPLDAQEMREEEDFTQGGFGLKTTLGNAVRHSMTSFLEDYDNSDENSPIVLKYFKHTGSTVVDSKNHSYNAETAYKKFLASLVYKTEMDPVMDLWIGVSNALREDVDEKNNPRYDNLVRWLDDVFYPQILGKSKEVNATSNKWRLTSNALTEKVLGIPSGTPVVISQDKVLRAIKSSVTFSTMAFKIISPVRNALMISAINITQSTRGGINSILSKILGIPPETFEGISYKAAHPIFQHYLQMKLSGKEDESKLWNLAKRYNWLPDHQVYAVNNDRLLSKSIQLGVNSHAYMFYQMGENLGALWQLAGLLKGIQIENVEGKKSSVWDAYDDQGNWTFGVRGKVDRGNGNIEELTELDSLEIKNLKRAYEKLNGSYRQEEKMAIESTVLGEFLSQFKRYFYQYMKVLFASPYKDITVGKYMLDVNATRPGDVPVYKWHSDVMEGQFRVLAASMLALLTPGRSIKGYLTDTDRYGADTLQGHKARALATLVNTGLWFAMLMWAFSSAFDDDDKKKYKGKLLQRTIQDLTRGAHPKDLFETIKSPVVAAERVSNIGAAMWDFMTKGIVGETTKEGYLKGSKTLLRALPGASNVIQMQDFFGKEGVEADDHIFGIIPR